MRIAKGSEDFVTLRRSYSYYVDKTELLYDLFDQSNNTVTLFMRPRRFGKTLNMSMIDAFLTHLIEKSPASVMNRKCRQAADQYLYLYAIRELIASFHNIQQVL